MSIQQLAGTRFPGCRRVLIADEAVQRWLAAAHTAA